VRRKVTSASLPTESIESPLEYDQLRSFQMESLDWYHDDTEPTVAATVAPTGGGKSAIFSAIAQSPSTHRTLLVYPTNALLNQQASILESSAPDLTIVRLTGDTLTQHGHARLEELLQYAQRPAVDVVVTNPDILQALFSFRYVGDTGQSLDFFKHFSAVIYDEFHFYSLLGASGILSQIRMLGYTMGSGKVLLTSATPDEQFLEHISQYLDQDVRTIRATPIATTLDHTTANQYRFETELVRHTDDLRDEFETALKLIRSRIEASDGSPSGAIIFNSAHQSNLFQQHVERVAPDVAQHIEKDNGYDTKSETELAEEFVILNTTSKGEVGLHYDLDLLLMQAPFTGQQFLQRFGRAGRSSPATVHVFGVGELTWPQRLNYPEFENAVYETFDTPLSSHSTLLTLCAIRSALAVIDRERDTVHRNPEMYHLSSTPTYGQWKNFISSVVDETDSTQSYGPLDAKPSQSSLDVLKLIRSTFDGLRSLRGQSLSYVIEYPNGDAYETTTYDLVRTLTHYGIEDVDDEVIRVGGDPESVTLSYPGLSEPFDAHLPAGKLNKKLTDSAVQKARQASFNAVPVSSDEVVEFLQPVPLQQTLLPTKIETPLAVFDDLC